MAKPDVVVAVVLVVNAPSVDSGAADADALVPFFLPILLNRDKLFRVNRARFSSGSLSSSLLICRFRDHVAEEACSCPSTLRAGREVSRCLGGLGFGCWRVICMVRCRFRFGQRVL